MSTSKIIVKGIQVYAHHGCLPEERKIGGDYSVDVSIEADLSKASRSDKLNDTIDYVTVSEIIQKEMSIPSKLIEHVAGRILKKLKAKFRSAASLEVTVTKHAPPIPGEVEQVSVTLFEK